MAKSPKFSMNRILARMDLHTKSEASELRRLCKKQGNLEIAQSLTDALLGNLTYLCNFTHAVHADDSREEMSEVSQRLQDFIRGTFENLTGQKYRPPILRRMAYAEKLMMRRKKAKGRAS